MLSGRAVRCGWNSCNQGLKKNQIPSQVKDGKSTNQLVNYEVLYLIPEIHGRFGPCFQSIFIVSVMLWFKIVVFMLEKTQATSTEVIYQIGCVRTVSPGIYCICSSNILDQASLWSR